ncbi:MAG TPA: ATP-binding protein [Myxococcaceae bacterium]|nr:ATP-binding protein [Myxococcaceae bacterium]
MSSPDPGDVERPESSTSEVRKLRASLDQTDRLVHELRVHQVELEFQNRALREAQEQLELSRQRYAELYDFAPVAYLSLDAEGTIGEVNVAAARLLGHDRGALLGRRLQTVVGFADPQAFHGALRQALASNQESRTELSFRSAGLPRATTVEMLVLPVFDTELRSVRARVALVDVTSRLAAEQTVGYLSMAGARLSRIGVGTPALIEEIASAGATGFIDGCWVELDGASSAAWRTEPLRRKMIQEQVEALRPQLLRTVEQAVSEARAVAGRWNEERAPASVWPVISGWVSAPLWIEQEVRGSVTLIHRNAFEVEPAALAVAEEFARRASMFLENARLFRQTEEAVRARDEMVSVLAHDLSNSLFSIRLHAQRGLGKGGEHAGRALEAIDRGVSWMDTLVKTVLDVSATDAGGLQLHRKAGDLVGVLESACALQLPNLEERGLHLERRWPTTLPAVVDHERVLQVLVNLLGNAVKFTPAGGRIVVGAAREPGSVRLWVADSGPGVPREHLGHLFQRGWQAEPKGGGRGLGLYICRLIVEAHGGNILVDRASEGGASFNVLLPDQATTASPPDPEAPER